MKEYDERGMQIRGRAAQVGLIMLVVLIMLKNMFTLFGGVQYSSAFDVDLACAWLAILYVDTVVVYYRCMRSDGARVSAICFTILGVFSLWAGISFLIRGVPIYTNRILDTDVLEIVKGIAFLMPGIAYVLSWRKEKKENKKEAEENYLPHK